MPFTVGQWTAAAVLLVALSGCNYLRMFPLYSELYVASPSSIKLDYVDDPRWWDYPTLSMIRGRVEEYCATHPDVPVDVAESLRALVVRDGMDADQVMAVLGRPSKRRRLSSTSELWTYRNRRVAGVRRWYYSWGKLQFDDGRLVQITFEGIEIHK